MPLPEVRERLMKIRLVTAKIKDDPGLGELSLARFHLSKVLVEIDTAVVRIDKALEPGLDRDDDDMPF